MSTAENSPSVELTDEPLFEIIDGQRVKLPPMGVFESRLANLLAYRIWVCLGKDRAGEPFVEQLFQLTTEQSRRPDVAYVPYERWPDRKVPMAEACVSMHAKMR